MTDFLSILLFSRLYLCLVRDEVANALSQKAYRLPRVFAVFVQICHKVSRFRKLWALAQLLMGRGRAEQGREGLVVVEAGEGGRIVSVWKGKGK